MPQTFEDYLVDLLLSGDEGDEPPQRCLAFIMTDDGNAAMVYEDIIIWERDSMMA